MKDALVRIIATGFYSGYGRPFPGTWGTIPACLLAYFLVGGNQALLSVIALGALVLSVWASGQAERVYGHDARKIVIDEWAGMFIALILVPYSLTNYAVAFVLFRVFDVIKLPPAKQAERLPGGWGVTMDDVVAGVQANVATHLVIIGLSRIGQSGVFA
jgi:phosphatidylglycerophosphatase A